jgi:hypothetical protein
MCGREGWAAWGSEGRAEGLVERAERPEAAATAKATAAVMAVGWGMAAAETAAAAMAAVRAVGWGMAAAATAAAAMAAAADTAAAAAEEAAVMGMARAAAGLARVAAVWAAPAWGCYYSSSLHRHCRRAARM